MDSSSKRGHLDHDEVKMIQLTDDPIQEDTTAMASATAIGSRRLREVQGRGKARHGLGVP